MPLNQRAVETLRFWAEQFPDRRPEHCVFPVERYGLHGKKGTFGGEVRPYELEPSKPVGTIQSAWESAKERTRRACPQCQDGVLVDREPPKKRRGKRQAPTASGYVCESCALEVEELPQGLSKFRFHDLRHTAVSRMIAASQPLPIIAKVVGWKLSTVIEMAERYGHFEEDALRRAVETIRTPLPYDSPYANDVDGERVQ